MEKIHGDGVGMGLIFNTVSLFSRGSSMAPLERAIVVSYRLSIVTIALSVTIRPQFAIECLQRSNKQGGGSLGPNFQAFPLQ